VEPVFGQIKAAMGLRRFSLRGLLKVPSEWAIVCACHNLLKLYRRNRLRAKPVPNCACGTGNPRVESSAERRKGSGPEAPAYGAAKRRQVEWRQQRGAGARAKRAQSAPRDVRGIQGSDSGRGRTAPLEPRRTQGLRPTRS